MLLYERPYGCDSCLPEDKKGKMWHGKEKCCGLWPPAFPRSLGFIDKPRQTKVN